jgi:transcriptional regulator with XRE-family HTH domain
MQLRLDRGLSQIEAARAIGYKHPLNLSLIENGQVIASVPVMRKLQELYGVKASEIMAACCDAFEHGRVLVRHRRRVKKLRGHYQKPGKLLVEQESA